MPELDFKNPDYVPIYKERARRLAAIRADKKLLIATLKHYETAETGLIDFIQDWFITYDPRLLPEPVFIPFMLFPHQKEYPYWLKDKFETKKDGLAEKSRDDGFTWLNMSFAIWLWRFKAGAKIGFGS